MTTDILKTSRDWAQTTPQGWILVVDDHPLFCDALELTLRSVMPGINVKTADTMERALALLAEEPQPRLVALDLNLPDVAGVDGVIEISRAAGAAPVLVVSSMDDARMVSSVLAAGASGFVPKHSPRAKLEEAINAIADGQTYKPDSFNDPEDDAVSDAVSRLSDLTAQQSRILQLICEGKLNKQIAFDLSIAETTVKAHVTAIMRKLGVHSRTQAVLVSQKAQFNSILPES
ncbi:response regulator transcription factor [uncultured Roseobacter sp.]|uniref:response regulator n=1 Tax=uncultured Roseobacter sp. TaxID=114847 RepID=UPI0026399DF7|nr:response regulator transcription factor [uncultured Roseobacter sp.]